MSKAEELKNTTELTEEAQKKDDIFSNDPIEEDEQLDEESKKALQNARFDENAFTKTKNPKESELKQEKKTSSKKNKKQIQDFSEYAQQKGINYNISYEDNFEKKQNNYQKKPENKEGPKTNQYNNSEKPQYNNNQGKTQNYYPKKQGGGVKKPFKKNNTTSEFSQFNNQKTTGTNKFDVVPGGYMSNPYYNQQYNNPETQQNYESNNEYYNQNLQKHLEEDNSTDPDTRICNTLNYYFSIENLNNNYHIRSLLDSQGYVLAEEIMNFNKMKNNAVTLEKKSKIYSKNLILQLSKLSLIKSFI